MKIDQSLFDTTLLGCGVYKIFLDSSSKKSEIEDAVKNIEKGIIFCFVPVESYYNELLMKLQFNLVSIRNIYRYNGVDRKIRSLPAEFSISPFSPEVPLGEIDIENLALTIGKQTRYFKDRQIPEDKGKAVYMQWIKNSLYHGLATRCFIARKNRKVIGICSVKIKDTSGEIDLLGVLPEFQGKNVGTYLIHAALDFLLSNHVDPITVVTAGENITSNIFFQRNNFVIEKVELVYHKHIDS